MDTVVTGNVVCAVHIAAVHSGIWRAEIAELYKKCICNGES
jgi:hypothetical protein